MRFELCSPVWKKCPIELKIFDSDLHIWRFNLANYSNHIDHLFTFLSNDEKSKAERYYFDKHRQRYVIARYILRQLLGKYLNKEAGEINFSYNKYGKPFLDKIDVIFNVSHSKNVALYAFGRVDEVGIDVEVLNTKFVTLEVAEHFFSNSEFQKLESLPLKERVTAFFICWTRKESYIKAKGQGLSIPLNSFAVDVTSNSVSFLYYSNLFRNDVANYEFFTFSPYNNYIASVSISHKSAKFYFFEGNY